MKRILSIIFVLLLLPKGLCYAQQDSSQQFSSDHSGFVLVTDVVPDAILEIRYYSTYNFVGARIDGYEAPVALITREAAKALKKVSDDLIKQGYRIKIYDIYRPQSAVDHFGRWGRDYADTLMKRSFYPDKDKRVLFREGFISHKSGHSRGSTVDLTIVDAVTGKDVDMGSPFDMLSDISFPSSDRVSEQQKKNRMILRDAMVRGGFRPMSTEWWHFTLVGEPYPDTYFTFPVKIY